MFDDFDTIDLDLTDDFNDEMDIPVNDIIDSFSDSDMLLSVDGGILMDDSLLSDLPLYDSHSSDLLTTEPTNSLNAEEDMDDHVTELIDDDVLSEEQGGEVSFLGHSQSEINRHKSQAEHDKNAAESDMRHFKKIAESKERMGEPHGFENYQYQQAKHRFEEAEKELKKWRRIRPDE